jgi:hypothetical protein
MSPYITFKDKNSKGDLILFILQREFPHYCAGLAFLPVLDSICCVPIAGHHLYLAFEGTIRGRFIPSYNNASEEIQAVMSSMASWFYAERILPEPKRYKKWLIPVS